MTKTTGSRSPEFRLAAHALGGLREDLLRDPFAYRLLPPLRQGSPPLSRLPARVRPRAAWAVHTVVAGFALIAGYVALDSAGGEVEGLVMGLLTAAPVLLTLVRPVGAWWFSLLMIPVTGGLGGFDDDWPLPPGMVVAHLAVLVVVAARTRPRTAVWMWSLSAGYFLLAEVLPAARSTGNGGPFLVGAAFLLLLVCFVQVRRAGQREIVAQKSVTAVERDRRTLLEERTTIARELHDVVAHHMSVVAIQAEAAPYRVQDPPPELEQAFATIRENAVAALTELRRVLGVVRASDHEAPDAPQPRLADLTRLLANVRDTGLDVEQVTTGAVRELPQGVELSAYRIVQEALSNVLRHAPGASARVEVGYVIGGLGLRVVNGPCTADAPPSPGAGHGVTGMRERVAMLDGEMTAEPTEEGGFEVTVFVPVPAVGPQTATVPATGPETPATVSAHGAGTVRDAIPGQMTPDRAVPPRSTAVEDAVPAGSVRRAAGEAFDGTTVPHGREASA